MLGEAGGTSGLPAARFTLAWWSMDSCQKGQNVLKIRTPFSRLDLQCSELNVTMCVFFPSPTASMPMAVLNLGHIYPFQRGFFCKDNSIQYPYHDSTVTSTMLTVLGLGLPLSSVSKCTRR